MFAREATVESTPLRAQRHATRIAARIAALVFLVMTSLRPVNCSSLFNQRNYEICTPLAAISHDRRSRHAPRVCSDARSRRASWEVIVAYLSSRVSGVLNCRFVSRARASAQVGAYALQIMSCGDLGAIPFTEARSCVMSTSNAWRVAGSDSQCHGRESARWGCGSSVRRRGSFFVTMAVSRF